MSDKLPVSKMCKAKLTLRMRNTVRHLKNYAMNLGLNTPPPKRLESFVLAKRFFGRGGLVIGTAAVMLSCFYLSNVVVRFDMLSADDEISEKALCRCLREGVETGTYIPSIDLIVTRTCVKSKVEGISWRTA